MIDIGAGPFRATFSDLGARLVSFFADGIDLVAGAGTDGDFIAGDYTAGAVCGRFAGRIRNATAAIGGRSFALQPNMGVHQLHGGPDNFAVRRWQSEIQAEAVRFRLVSPDGDQGFPGRLAAEAIYSISPRGLALELSAMTDRETVVNLTNHAYWNLAGGGPIFAHELEIAAGTMLPLDGDKLPTGELRAVAGTRYDFRARRRIGEAYDNAFVLDGRRGELKQACTLRDPASGRTLELHATECCLQIYTADHWTPDMKGRTGPLAPFTALALEAQNFPDAPTHPQFPSALLRPGEAYRHRIEWRFR